MLQLNDRIIKSTMTRTALEQFITQYARDYLLGSPKHDIIIDDNKISVQIKCTEEMLTHAVIHMHGHGKIINNPIVTNARIILEERITTKAKKCKDVRGEIWLGLLNNYDLADAGTYRSALGMFNVEHPFSKILLVSLDGAVETLYAETDARIFLKRVIGGFDQPPDYWQDCMPKKSRAGPDDARAVYGVAGRARVCSESQRRSKRCWAAATSG
jgi:hypothetical protein